MNKKEKIVVLIITAGASAVFCGDLLSYLVFDGSLMGGILGILFGIVGGISVSKGTDLLNN